MNNLLLIPGFIILTLLFLLRKQYGEPPCIKTKVIETFIPPDSDSPLVKIQEDAVSCIHHRYSEGFSFIFRTSLDSVKKYSESTCFPSEEVEELTYFEYQWEKRWQQILLKNHPYGDTHYLFPKKWITNRTKRIVEEIRI